MTSLPVGRTEAHAPAGMRRGAARHGPLRAIAVALAVLVTAAPSLRAADDDFYISLPVMGGIYRLDAVSHQLTPFATGFGVPFYGAWAADGFFYVPDRVLGAIFRVSTAGAITPFAAGGFLQSPVTIVEAPDGGFISTDLFSETVVRLSTTGQQTLIADAASSGGLISGPGGTAFGPDGTLYVANNIGDTIAGVDTATGATWLVSDSPLVEQPGGVAIDGAGNLFVASYSNSHIARVRLDTGVAEIFCADPFFHNPNDVRLAHDGGLFVTMKNAALVRIDATGQLSVIAQDATLGEWDGVARPSDTPPCTGRFLPYGTGTAGSGGSVPRLAGIFSPCPGAAIALEFDGLLGGAIGALAWGLSPVNLPFKGAHLLVNPGPPGGFIPLVFPGAGAGGGGLVLPFTLPDDPALTGFSFYLQALAKDPGAPGGISASNGLQELIGA